MTAPASRTAESHAAFLLPHLRPGMTLLDLGSGPGSITIGLAAAVAPGPTIGVDLRPRLPEDVSNDGIALMTADVRELPLQDASVDAIYIGAVLQHLDDPMAALREARRVARPGAVIAVADADWDGEIFYPTSPMLRRSRELMEKLRHETSPFVGKRLRTLLTEAGFVRCEASARALYYGTSDEVRDIAGSAVEYFESPEVERAVDAGWTTREELAGIAQTWRAWGEEPGAFMARYWCEAIGWVEEAADQPAR